MIYAEAKLRHTRRSWEFLHCYGSDAGRRRLLPYKAVLRFDLGDENLEIKGFNIFEKTGVVSVEMIIFADIHKVTEFSQVDPYDFYIRFRAFNP